MRIYLFNPRFAAVGTLVLLACSVMAAPPMPVPPVNNANKSVNQQNVAAGLPSTAVAPPSYPPIGGTNAVVPGGWELPGYFTGTPASAWSGLIGSSPPGGRLYPGP